MDFSKPYMELSKSCKFLFILSVTAEIPEANFSGVNQSLLVFDFNVLIAITVSCVAFI
jgi:hypothetical protein